jgi:hypothetical protein
MNILQSDLETIRKNGTAEEEVRKTERRVQKAAYDLGFKLLSSNLQEAT